MNYTEHESNITVIRVIENIQYYVLLNMLYDYIKELHEIDNTVEIKTKSELKQEYFYDDDIELYLLYYGYKAIGFAVIGVESCCHPLADIYINEFYIMPEFRKQGFGRALFEGIITYYDIEKLCFYILKKNIDAFMFWNTILLEDWSNTTDRYSNLGPENCEWFMYERKY